MDDQLNNTLKQEIEQSWIADLDPILEGGFKTAFRQLLAIEVRTVDATGNSLGVKDVLTVRIMIKPANEGYSDLKM